MLPNREGRFKAFIAEHGVDETGPNRLATFICKFSLSQELANGEWIAVDEDLDITGYFYLEKKDGSINQITVEQLKAAFGWDGRDPLWLQDTDFRGLTVQVKLEFELYDGRTKLKVRYVDAENADGRGVPKANDNTRRNLSNRLGSKLRAIAGGTPAPAPRPTTPAPSRVGTAPTTRGAAEATVAAAPTTGGTAPATENAAQTTDRAAPTTAVVPPTVEAAPPVRSAPPVPVGSMQRAWGIFLAAVPQGWSQKSVDEEWFRVLGELLPGKAPESITPAEWAHVEQEAPARIIPM